MDLVKRSAIAKGTAVAALAIVILAGAVGLFYYTTAPASPPSRGTSTTSSSTSSNTSTTSTNSTQPNGPTAGHCVTNSAGQCQTPQGAWAQYLGYIPAGYVLAPHYPIAATYPCPSGMNPTQC